MYHAERFNLCANPFNPLNGIIPEFDVTAPGVLQMHTDEFGNTAGSRFIGGDTDATLVFQCRPNYLLHFEQQGGELIEASGTMQEHQVVVYRCNSSTDFQFDKMNLGEPRCKLLA